MRPAIHLLSLLTAFSMTARAAEKEGDLTVMSFNCWYSLTKVKDGLPKAIAAIKQTDADIIGLQECSKETAAKLAEALGYHRVDSAIGAVQIISRHPVVETFPVGGIDPSRAAAARIRFGKSPGKDIIIYNVHLDAGRYGPYAIRREGADAEKVLAEETRSERPGQIAGILESMAPHLRKAAEVPVILTGDLNSPSHLDWTRKTAKLHGGVKDVAWPVTLLTQKAGLVDSFRLLHPDPSAEPGNTWSTIHKDGEPQDRIDFVFHKGESLRPVSSRTFATSVARTIGPWGDDIAPVADNEWPSDHAAVITTYRFTN